MNPRSNNRSILGRYNMFYEIRKGLLVMGIVHGRD